MATAAEPSASPWAAQLAAASELAWSALAQVEPGEDARSMLAAEVLWPELMVRVAAYLAESTGQAPEPGEIIWCVAADRAGAHRARLARSDDPDRHRTWAWIAAGYAACLDAAAGPDGHQRWVRPDLSPLPAETGPPARADGTRTGGGPSRPQRTARGLAQTLGAVVGAVLGFVVWPVAAAIAGTGPASPYAAGGSPLGEFGSGC